VLILKGDEVVCFDTLLQVLILKVFAERGEWLVRGVAQNSFGAPPPRVFCSKSLDLFDYKGVDFFRDDKESAIV
jgi:hypothetical protein